MTEEQRRKYLHDENGDTRTNDEIYRLIQIEGLQAQLSSKEQECEELKSIIIGNDERWTSVYEELSSLRAENERLENLLFLAESALKTIRLEPTMSGSVFGNFDRKKTIDAIAEFYAAFSDSGSELKTISELRKRCEDLEALLREATYYITRKQNASLCSDIDKLLSQ